MTEHRTTATPWSGASFLNGELARADEPTPTDPLFDYFNDLAEAVRGTGGGESLGDLNERLRAKFREFRIDRVTDDVVGIQPVLRADTVDFDWRATFEAWFEAGEPDPTPEQVEEYDALVREAESTEPVWIDGTEAIRPPAKALMVPLADRGSDSQETRRMIDATAR